MNRREVPPHYEIFLDKVAITCYNSHVYKLTVLQYTIPIYIMFGHKI